MEFDCPVCGYGIAILLGILGNAEHGLAHLRCHGCGIDFSIQAKDLDGLEEVIPQDHYGEG